jgi:hypothetical protein
MQLALRGGQKSLATVAVGTAIARRPRTDPGVLC